MLVFEMLFEEAAHVNLIVLFQVGYVFLIELRVVWLLRQLLIERTELFNQLGYFV